MVAWPGLWTQPLFLSGAIKKALIFKRGKPMKFGFSKSIFSDQDGVAFSPSLYNIENNAKECQVKRALIGQVAKVNQFVNPHKSTEFLIMRLSMI